MKTDEEKTRGDTVMLRRVPKANQNEMRKRSKKAKIQMFITCVGNIAHPRLVPIRSIHPKS